MNGTCSNTSYHSQSSCVSHYKVWTAAAHSTWNGCVTDRDQNFDTTNDAPTAGANLYPTEQYASCPASLMGLSNDWTALSNKIDAMQPVGNTNQAIGLQMGWQSLTAAPFTIPATDPNYQYNQVVIILSDGLNTQDRWYTNASSIDARQQKVCDNIKAAGITVYSVQVNTGNDPTSTILKSCASDARQVLPVDLRRRNRHRVRPDRHRAVQFAAGDVTPATASRRGGENPPRRLAAGIFRRRANHSLTTVCKTRLAYRPREQAALTSQITDRMQQSAETRTKA